MKLIWNKQTLMLAVSMLLILFLALFYGRIYLLGPMKEESEQLSQVVERQQALMETYPPDENILQQYQDEYETTQGYLPGRENINEAILLLEQTAKQERVTLNRVSRMGEPQPVEGLGQAYQKNGYQVEVSSESAENIRHLVEALTGMDRVWNVSTFRYEKYDDNLYEGMFTFELFYHMLEN